MTGVEILSQNNVYNVLLPEWVVTIILIVFIFSVIGCGMSFLCEKLFISMICAACALVGLILMTIAGTPNKNSLDYIEYKVIIDDSVSMVEFSNKYEILDQDGRIYVVREREN